MGLVQRLFSRRSAGETRATDASWDALSYTRAFGGYVDPAVAENISTVSACVQVIASAVACLPANVYRSVERGRELDPRHPVSRLVVRGWSNQTSWADGMEFIVASALLRGNGLAEIVRDRSGKVTSLIPIPWQNVSVTRLSSGRLVYDVTDAVDAFGSSGRSRRLLDGEVLHIRDRTDDGIVGRSRLSRAAGTLDGAHAVQEYSNATFRNGVRPSLLVQAAHMISPEQFENLKRRFQVMFSRERAGLPLILDQGLEAKPLSMSLEDAELLAQRRFTTEELARIFQVPPPLVGIWDHSSFTNSETAGRWFAQYTLAPWITKIETEFRRQVFSDASADTHGLEIDLSAFLRGDPAARWKAWDTAIRNGILTPNEIREVEGWNPREGGDSFSEFAKQTMKDSENDEGAEIYG